MQKLISAIDNEELNDMISDLNSGLKVKVGKENLSEGLSECAVISLPYFINDNDYGTILLIGPTRMNYRATIPLIEYVAKSMIKLDKR